MASRSSRNLSNNNILFYRRRRSGGAGSDAFELLRNETQGLALDFTDDFFFASEGFYGSANIKDTTTPANTYDSSPTKTASSLLTYTSPSVKMCMGPAGTLRYQAHNIILRSQTFTNAAWTVGLATVSDNAATAPDGTTTAALLTDGAGNGNHRIYTTNNITTVAGASYAASVQVKAGTGRYFYLHLTSADGVTRYGVVFDLQTVAATATSTTGSPTGTGNSIAAISNGFYLLTITMVAATTTTLFDIGFSNAAVPTFSSSIPTYNGAGGDTVYIWGAHLRRTPSDSTYLSTTTAARYALPLEWSSAGVLQGLRVEESRTNLLTYSNTFSNAAWTKFNINDTAFTTTTTGPDGVSTSFKKLTENTTNGNHGMLQQVTKAASAIAYTATIYAKAAERSRIEFVCASTNGGTFATYDISGGQIGIAPATYGAAPYTSVSASIVSIGSGIYRCVLSFTSNTDLFVNFEMRIDAGTGTGAQNDSYAGTNGNGLFIYGAQLEAGAFATSHIAVPAGSTVTRAADNISLATSAFPHSATNWTLFVQAISSPSTASAAQLAVELHDTTVNERAGIYRSLNDPRAFVTDGGASLADVDAGAWAASSLAKVAAAFAANDVAVSVAGGAVVTDASLTMPTVTTMNIGSTRNGTSQFNGILQKLTYRPRRVINADLVTETT